MCTGLRLQKGHLSKAFILDANVADHSKNNLTQVVIPLDEKRAILSSKSMPPTPITSIWSAGLFRVLEQVGRQEDKNIKTTNPQI